MMHNSPYNGAKESSLSMFILDVLRHDEIEQMSSILKMLNNEGCIGWRQFWPRDFSLAEVIPALEELMRRRYVLALVESDSEDGLSPVEINQIDIRSDHERLWFRLTEEGRLEWSRWTPPDACSN